MHTSMGAKARDGQPVVQKLQWLMKACETAVLGVHSYAAFMSHTSILYLLASACRSNCTASKTGQNRTVWAQLVLHSRKAAAGRHKVASIQSTKCSSEGACKYAVYTYFTVKNLWTRQDCAVGRRRQFGFSIAANSSHPAFPLVSNTCTALAHLSSASQKSRADSTSSWNVFSNSLHIRA